MPTHLKPIGHKFPSPCLCTNVTRSSHKGTLLGTVKDSTTERNKNAKLLISKRPQQGDDEGTGPHIARVTNKQTNTPTLTH